MDEILQYFCFPVFRQSCDKAELERNLGIRKDALYIYATLFESLLTGAVYSAHKG